MKKGCKKEPRKEKVRKSPKALVPTVAPDTVVSEICAPKHIIPKQDQWLSGNTFTLFIPVANSFYLFTPGYNDIIDS